MRRHVGPRGTLNPQTLPVLIGMAIFVSLFGIAAASAQQVSRPVVPDAIQAPSGEAVVLLAHASGSQIYTCQAAADGKVRGSTA